MICTMELIAQQAELETSQPMQRSAEVVVQVEVDAKLAEDYRRSVGSLRRSYRRVGDMRGGNSHQRRVVRRKIASVDEAKRKFYEAVVVNLES